MSITCANCNRENPSTEKLCLYCGNPLVDVVVKTVLLETEENGEIQSNYGKSRSPSRIRFIINHNEQDYEVSIETRNMSRMTIGRLDPISQQAPPIDLSEFDAINKGVSRQHAVLIRKDATIQIADLAAANGTFLNGQRLIPEQERILRDGDDLRLGHLVMRVKFGYE